MALFHVSVPTVCWHKEPQSIMKPVYINKGGKQEWEMLGGKHFKSQIILHIVLG